MSFQRKKGSRSKEISIIFSFFKNPKLLLDFIKENPNGAKFTLENITVEYGKIQGLIKDLDSNEKMDRPFDINPNYIGHIDNLNNEKKKLIEKKFNLEKDSLSSKTSKVDLLIIDNNKDIFYISYKDETTTKLGQLSKTNSYGKAELCGSFDSFNIIKMFSNRIPQNLKFSDTSLTDIQFSKLNEKDKKLAFIKKSFPKEWYKIWNEELNNAYIQLEKFGKVLKDDKDSLIEFIKYTFSGNQKDLENFYLVFGKKSFKFSKILKKLKEIDLYVNSKIYESEKGKKSLLVSIKIKNQIYGLTKIEPSFDGLRDNVSQTKGIIFYFQDYPENKKLGNNFKRLFQDIV